MSAVVRKSRCGGALAISLLSRELLVDDFYSPLNGTVVVRAVVSRGQQSRKNTVGMAGRLGTLSPGQTFNDLSTFILF